MGTAAERKQASPGNVKRAQHRALVKPEVGEAGRLGLREEEPCFTSRTATKQVDVLKKKTWSSKRVGKRVRG